MGLKEIIFRRVIKRFGLEEIRPMVEDMGRLGRPSEHTYPKDLLPIVAREAARGVFNTQFSWDTILFT